ncbi:hypothetical protein DASC09_035530 [Saccharomycopsis crataegensis]|uniref:PSP1 C-terminal domain-containing protein n=1 Tax=Saccharomycopsis crataegensis TaxID=43959 RepID=A0AAV5QMW4_9ASCO|nr:hypothetical protein DASC09_035530 [Saccharomycopsis crataegensis]
MFLYNQQDRPIFNSPESLRTSTSPDSVYSSSFSRANTPVNFANTPATTAENTPVQYKEMEVNREFQFGRAQSTSSATSPSNLPNISVSDDMEKYISDLTTEGSTEPAQPIRSVSPFHLSNSIWDSSSAFTSPHKSQESSSSFMADNSPLKALPGRTNSLPKSATLSIDINQANGPNIKKPIGSASFSGSSNTLTLGEQHSRKLSGGDSIWGNFTPSSEFFGKSITSNDMTSLNSGINYLNIKQDAPAHPQQQLKSPLLASFNNKYSYTNNNGIDAFSPAKDSFFVGNANAASVPRSATGFFEQQPQQQPQQPQQLSQASMAQILNYFTRSEDSQIQQLTLEGLKNLNYDKVFSSKAGQLPRFLLPGQDANLNDAAFNMQQQQQQQQHQHQLVLVSFKNGRLDIFFHPLNNAFNPLKVGDLVFVEADRGKDLGMVVSTDISIDDARLIKMIQNEEQTDALRFDNNDVANNNNNNPPQPHIPKQVVRTAMPHEVSQIIHKQSDELKALAIMQSKIIIHKVPMKVLGAEYQWDRRKLTFYYVANKRIDFRDLVKDIFRIYKTRIWMCAVTPTDMSIKDSIVDESMIPPPQQFQFPPAPNATPMKVDAHQRQPSLIRHENLDSISSINSDLNNNYSYSTLPVNFHQQQSSFGQLSFNNMPMQMQPQVQSQNPQQQHHHQRQYTSSGLTANVWNA